MTLHEEFTQWVKEQGLPQDCDATDLLMMGVNPAQTAWLESFCKRWEAATEIERWGE